MLADVFYQDCRHRHSAACFALWVPADLCCQPLWLLVVMVLLLLLRDQMCCRHHLVASQGSVVAGHIQTILKLKMQLLDVAVVGSMGVYGCQARLLMAAGVCSSVPSKAGTVSGGRAGGM